MIKQYSVFSSIRFIIKWSVKVNALVDDELIIISFIIQRIILIVNLNFFQGFFDFVSNYKKLREKNLNA